MLSQERQTEMLKKVAGLVKTTHKKVVRGTQGSEADQIGLELEVSIPQALVGMGIATTEEEGQKFLSGFIASSLTAVAMEMQDPGSAFHGFVKFGFLLGVSATKTKEGN